MVCVTFASALTVLVCAAASAAGAQPAAYPWKPVRVIVHSPPGGAPDVVARILAERLAPALGQAVVIDNRAGASGTIALTAVAKAEPDGHTLGTISPPQVVAPSLIPQLPYDTRRDLAAVRQTTRAALLIVVREASPWRSIADVIAMAKAHPARLTYASAGNGTPQHLAAEAFKRAAGLYVYHVPYKGAPAALAALLGEQVDLLFTSAVTVDAHVRSGKLRALATTGPTRHSSFGDVPSLVELGFAGFDVRDWQGLVAPAQTPKPVLDRLAAEIGKVLEDAEVVQRLAALGTEPVRDSDARSFSRLIQSELERWGQFAREGALRAD